MLARFRFFEKYAIHSIHLSFATNSAKLGCALAGYPKPNRTIAVNERCRPFFSIAFGTPFPLHLMEKEHDTKGS